MRDILLSKYGFGLGMEIRVVGVESRYDCVAF